MSLPNPDLPTFSPERKIRVRTALISVSEKSNLIKHAKALSERGISLISTGGTYRTISKSGIPVRDVSNLTQYPEIMDGRVKTLHPGVHGGILGNRDLDSHRHTMTEHKITPIDLLIVNLYPFEDTVAGDTSYDMAVENIDVGGPAMIRAAAKNHAHVAVCVDSEDVKAVLSELDDHDGRLGGHLRRRLAAKAFSRTAAYDAAIGNYLTRQAEEATPAYRTQAGILKQAMRYGENPHQSAALYLDDPACPGVATATLHQGKALSYNNINDTDAAFELVAEFGAVEHGAKPAVAIIKHANPCGVAIADDFLTAYQNALACDPVSAFGGVIALNGPLDAKTAGAITKVFTEVIIAPSITDEAMAVLVKVTNLRILSTNGLPDPSRPGTTFRNVAGGLLVQDRDNVSITVDDVNIVTERQPSKQELTDMMIAWKVAKHVKSNAIVYVRDGATAGIGAGQMSRVDSAQIAARKAMDAQEMAGWEIPGTRGCACASDAFFPFTDGIYTAAAAGATALIQPGGSIRDAEVIEAANEAGLTMAFTGMRHFRH